MDGWTIQDPNGRPVHWDRVKVAAWQGYVRKRGDGRSWGELIDIGYRAVPGRPEGRLREPAYRAAGYSRSPQSPSSSSEVAGDLRATIAKLTKAGKDTGVAEELLATLIPPPSRRDVVARHVSGITGNYHSAAGLLSASERMESPAMPSRASTTSSSDGSSGRGTYALTLLKDDHQTVAALFERYEKQKDNATDGAKAKLAAQICDLLTIHAEMEERVFYPALRQAKADADILDEAKVEHAGAKDLIAQIRGMKPDQPLYDAKVKVLGEGVKHHVKEEEGEMFKEARAAGVDLYELGSEMQAFKESRTKA